MGLKLILIIALLGAAFFFRKKIRLYNVFLTLGNAAKSRFERSTPSQDETIFTVTPARPSRAALIFIVTGILILQLQDFWIIGLIPLAMGLSVFPIGMRHRAKSVIHITADNLTSGALTWPLSEITAINIHTGSNYNTDDPGQPIHTTPGGGLVYGGKSTTVMLTKAIARRAVERSYLVTLRTRQGGKEQVLGGGLTLECAQALREDLRAEIAKHGHPLPPVK